ncbi:FAD-dependent oxidoreductase [Acidithiobacillus sp. AMEEHan]|uniref:NAD(P)/FAD-dependent oxidoreductase n=1 Tax=Acidithiobacillus sp. AMEEHan TaxID=2994951 RepID=UPI0027E41B9A|nr:FAD-dependent oxidoreductase [Acidithiobacillus sp. AMEEHan]
MRVAVIGSGIAGLASAWLLRKHHRVSLFEADSRCGGHTHTVEIEHEGITAPVDTGFLVCNDWTYPHLLGLFAELQVELVASQMTFSVRLSDPELEWSGTDLNGLFAQRRNLLRPAFYGMLRDILRFNRDAKAWLRAEASDISLGEFLVRGRYGEWLQEAYLLPMAAAIWSCPVAQMRAYPARSFLRFYENHGLLNIFRRPQWLTVKGGGREYVQRILAQLDDLRSGTPVLRLEPLGAGIRVHSAAGVEDFDAVVSAVHSDQLLPLLGEHWPEHHAPLAAIRYQPNRAVLHRDASFLPQRRQAWSAWNFHREVGSSVERPVAVSYLINKLQPLPFRDPIIVTLNPEREPDPALVWREINYAHPVFDGPAVAAQASLRALQGVQGLYLAGAWLGYGFHEDGMRSAVEVARALGVRIPWEEKAATQSRPEAVLCPNAA